MTVSAIPHTVTPGEVAAKLAAASRPTIADVAAVGGGTNDQPAGIQIAMAQTMAEVRRMAGVAGVAYINSSPLTFISQR